MPVRWLLVSKCEAQGPPEGINPRCGSATTDWQCTKIQMTFLCWRAHVATLKTTLGRHSSSFTKSSRQEMKTKLRSSQSQRQPISWKQKCLAFKILNSVPFGDELYHVVQRYITKSPHHGDLRFKAARILNHVDAFSRFGGSFKKKSYLNSEEGGIY